MSEGTITNLRDEAIHAELREREYARSEALKKGGGDGTSSGNGGGGMEPRIQRLEEAIVAINTKLEELTTGQRSTSGLLSTLAADARDVKLSQVRVEERLERIMDKARDMPTPAAVDSMINSKLGIAAALFAALGVLIAAITYAAS